MNNYSEIITVVNHKVAVGVALNKFQGAWGELALSLIYSAEQ